MYNALCLVLTTVRLSRSPNQEVAKTERGNSNLDAAALKNKIKPPVFQRLPRGFYLCRNRQTTKSRKKHFSPRENNTSSGVGGTGAHGNGGSVKLEDMTSRIFLFFCCQPCQGERNVKEKLRIPVARDFPLSSSLPILPL